MRWATVVCILFAAAAVNADKTSTPGRSLWNATWTDLLKHDLLLKYDKFARPSQQYNTTQVTMDMEIKHIDLDEEKSMVTINGWSKFKIVEMYFRITFLASNYQVWYDDKLKWDANDYGGQYRLHMADHEIWQPDIVLYNSAQANAIDHFGNTNCLLSNDGRVLWVPPSQFFVYCNIKLRKWPYDKHTCVMQFGSWTYSVEEIKVEINTSTSMASEMGPSEWEIIDTKKTLHLLYYNCCTEAYPRMDFEFTFHRRNPAYTGLVFAPALVCIVLTLSVFWLPPTAGEKFLLSGITAVIITLFLIYFTQRLTVMIDSMPIIVEFYIYSLALVCLSLVTSVFAVNISRHPKPRPVPWGMNKLLTSRMGRFLQLPNIKTQGGCTEQDTEELHERSLVSDMAHEQDTKTTPTNSVRDWVVLAMAIDRLMFIAYVIIFTLLSIVLFLT